MPTLPAAFTACSLRTIVEVKIPGVGTGSAPLLGIRVGSVFETFRARDARERYASSLSLLLFFVCETFGAWIELVLFYTDGATHL